MLTVHMLSVATHVAQQIILCNLYFVYFTYYLYIIWKLYNHPDNIHE